MCLVSKSDRLKVAHEPIRCYKVLLIDMYGDYYTPYRMCEVDSCIVSGKRNFVARGGLDIIRFEPAFFEFVEDDYRYCMFSGVIHCYVNLEDVLKDISFHGYVLQKFSKKFWYKIFEVEVPVGVEYIEGKFSHTSCNDTPLNRLDLIGSKEVKFLREVELEVVQDGDDSDVVTTKGEYLKVKG